MPVYGLAFTSGFETKIVFFDVSFGHLVWPESDWDTRSWAEMEAFSLDIFIVAMGLRIDFEIRWIDQDRVFDESIWRAE